MEPVPLLTVGDLKSELSRWSNETPVTFYSPLREQEFRFYRYRPGDSVLVLEINEFPETSEMRRRYPWRRQRKAIAPARVQRTMASACRQAEASQP